MATASVICSSLLYSSRRRCRQDHLSRRPTKEATSSTILATHQKQACCAYTSTSIQVATSNSSCCRSSFQQCARRRVQTAQVFAKMLNESLKARAIDIICNITQQVPRPPVEKSEPAQAREGKKPEKLKAADVREL